MGNNRKNIAVIGTGFLGRVIADQATSLCGGVVSTYNQNKFFDSSIKFDFFKDNIAEILGGKKIDVVIIAAKIEFMEDKEILEGAMRKFLEYCEGKRLVYLSSDGIFDGEKGGCMQKVIFRPPGLFMEIIWPCVKS